eukprot:1894106-Amphidinium_carterae.1
MRRSRPQAWLKRHRPKAVRGKGQGSRPSAGHEIRLRFDNTVGVIGCNPTVKVRNNGTVDVPCGAVERLLLTRRPPSRRAIPCPYGGPTGPCRNASSCHRTNAGPTSSVRRDA